MIGTIKRWRSRIWVLAGLLLSPTAPGQAQVVVQIGQNFTATSLGNGINDSMAIPPDCNGAPGPNHYVEMINGRFSVFSKATGALVQSMTDSNFWKLTAGISMPSGWDVTDPRIIYDPTVQRWFASQVDLDTSGVINTNRILLAVSTTADPTGAWNGFALPGTPRGNYFADFPTLGVDAQGVYISANLFDVNGNFVGLNLISFPKAGLLASPPTIANRTGFGILNNATYGYIVQPAMCLDGSGGGNMLATASLGFDPVHGNFVTNTSLIGFTIQNAAGPGSATLTTPITLTVPPYTVPLDPTQPDGTASLADNDARFSALVYKVGGVFYAVHNTEVNNLAAIRWYRINATNYALLESGTITDTNLDLFYPCIAANSNSVVAIGYNGSSINTYVSCYAQVGHTAGGVTTFGPRLLLQAGSTIYHDDGELYYGNAESRWGDYNTMSVDPSDPNRFWTIQMYPSGSYTDVQGVHYVWSTQVTELRTAYPVLSITSTRTNAVLSWPGSAVTFNLESNTRLPATNSWTVVTGNFTTNNGIVSIQVPLSGTAKFFRLHLP